MKQYITPTTGNPRRFKIKLYPEGIIFCMVCLAFPLLSGAQGEFRENYPQNIVGFVENKGQVVDQNGRPNREVIYLLNNPGMNVQLRRDGFSYDVYSGARPKASSEDLSEVMDPSAETGYKFTFHRIDFDLLGSSQDCKIITSAPSAGYLNYYTPGTPVEGATMVRHYQTVTYTNVYPNIDLEFHSEGGEGFKYNFIVHPGGKIGAILIRITDPEIQTGAAGGLILENSIGRIEEAIPSSLLMTADGNLPVNVYFKKVGAHLYGFSADFPVPGDGTLLIDPLPRRLWGTYYGGTSNDVAEDLAIDRNGNLYFCGNTTSTGNIATSGSYQSIVHGGYDSFLVRFDQSGQRVWGTYFGGLSNELYQTCITDRSGNVYLAGLTASSTFIATPGSHQPVYGGGLADDYLAKFDPSGQLVWATYYGGSLTEDQVDCATDDSLNIYLCGVTQSLNNIATPGAFQPVHGGSTDAYLARFDSNGVRSWGTYFGGSDPDQGYACVTDHGNAVFFSGKTLSETGISTPGAHQPAHAGAGDAFLVKFSTAGQRQWGTYYGGSNTDETHGIGIDTNNNVYIGGYTTSSENISTPGTQQLNYAGFGDGFIARFSSDGIRSWGTYCGGFLQEVVSKHDLSIDDSCYIYFSGSTNSTDSIASPGAHQPVLSGSSDGFLVKYNDQGLRIWGTYYGGTEFDYAAASVSDNCGHQYLSGQTSSLSGISTPGTHQPGFGGGSQDTFLAKLTDCIPPDTAGSISGPVTVCADMNTVLYSVFVIPRATGYVWMLPPGFTITGGANTNTITVQVAVNAVSGVISVFGTSCCDDGEPSSIAVTVNPRPVPEIFGMDTLCEGTMELYNTVSGYLQYLWTVSPGGTVTTGGMQGDTSVTVLWNDPGTQWVSLNYTDTNGCSSLDPTLKNIEVFQGSPVDVTIYESLNNICQGTPVTFTAMPDNGGSNPAFQWTVNSINAGTNSPVFTYLPNNGDSVRCILTSSNTVCTSNNPAVSNTVMMIVNPYLPVSVSVSASQNPVCAGTSVTISATTQNAGQGALFQWQLNGMNILNNDSVVTMVPSDGDQVSCILTSWEACTVNNPAYSDTLILTVNPLLPASVMISASMNPVCSGLPVTFTATPVNGGSNPSYQWQVNGINAGTNSSVFTYIPASLDLVSCIMTSNLACVTNNPASSIQLQVSISTTPAVTFTPCFDTITTENAKPIRLKGGIPLGGNYSGPGVNGGFFYPNLAGVGTHVVTYTYMNSALCSNSTSSQIHEFPSPIFNCGSDLIDIRDGKAYPTIQINSQCWMAADLNFGTEILPNIHQRDNCVSEKYFNPVSAIQHPASVYQWDELMRYDPTPGNQGLCPPGWHIPTEAEWGTLFANWTNNAFAAAPLKYSGYSGFNAVLTGVRHESVQWDFQNFAAFYWSSTAFGPYKAWAHGMNDTDPSVSYYPSLRSNAFSIRCLRD